jgi:hypothetical protein
VHVTIARTRVRREGRGNRVALRSVAILAGFVAALAPQTSFAASETNGPSTPDSTAAIVGVPIGSASERRQQAPTLQLGVAFTGEFVASPGPMCPKNVATPCVIGSGGGLTLRAAWRHGPWYFGGAYEISKQDPNKIYQLAILQQGRFEMRRFFNRGLDTQPFFTANAGVAGYGDEWTVSTLGPLLGAGFGVETQIDRRTRVGVSLGYRAIYFSKFVDGSGAARDAGIAHFVGFDILLEARDSL